LTLCQNCIKPSDELLEIANIQTLLGKDYYVILRPSLYYNLEINKSNKAILIISIIFCILIILCEAFFIWKYIKLKKKERNSILQISSKSYYYLMINKIILVIRIIFN